MAIYAKKISKGWRVAFVEYERISGFEPLFQDDIDSGVISVDEAWSRNIKFLEDVVCEVSHITIPENPDLI
ncbi:MAG: hypothetical protein V7749_00955 [Cocleimonas sp.]